MEPDEFISCLLDNLHLSDQNGIEFTHIILNIASGLVNFMQEHHLLFDEVHRVVDVVAVGPDHLLLFLQDLLNQVLVVLTQKLRVATVLRLQGW